MKLSSLSLRTRILLWHGIMLACILTAFGLTAYRLNWDNELARLDGILAEPVSLLHRSLRAQNIRSRPNEDFRLDSAPPSGTFALPPEIAAQFESRGWCYVIWNRDGKLIRSSDIVFQNRQMPDCAGLVPFVAQQRTVGTYREAYIITPVGDCLLAAVSMTAATQSASRFGWQMFALVAIVLGFGLLVDAWILRRAIRPVELIISAAERISHGHLSARIETEHSSQELDRLTSVLNHTFASLDRAFTQQARFSADVAHELRTPVSVLITESQIALERQRSSEDYRDAIATCLRSARRMGGLIESLLDLSQIQAAPQNPHQPCDLAALTTEVIDSLQNVATTHGIELSSSTAAAPCQGNAEQLTQVIINLVSNAIQHNQRGGMVCIKTCREETQVSLRVSNTGPGIPAADLPHVFDRFYRTDASRNCKTGGAGLGLAISKAIADAHGAKLVVSSSSNERTIFTLILPIT